MWFTRVFRAEHIHRDFRNTAAKNNQVYKFMMIDPNAKTITEWIEKLFIDISYQ